jgi:hypothetical protein
MMTPENKEERSMELREFVAKALSAILDGVEDAIRTAPEDRQRKIAPVIAGEEDWSKAPLPVEFDVAITEADKGSVAGKGGIKVVAFQAGGEGSKAWEHSTVSRIKFSVPIIYGAQRIGRG